MTITVRVITRTTRTCRACTTATTTTTTTTTSCHHAYVHANADSDDAYLNARIDVHANATTDAIEHDGTVVVIRSSIVIIVIVIVGGLLT